MSPQPVFLCAREPAASSIGMIVVLKEGVAEQLLENPALPWQRFPLLLLLAMI
jgi:hypothetical protein